MKITVTQELLDKRPDLVDLGILVGQEIDSEEYDVPLEEQPQSPNEQNLDDDPPGTGSDRPKNPPPRP